MQRDDRAKEPRVDRRIRVPEVRVIDADGSNIGTMSTQEALRRALEQGLNLVEVSPNSRPPVCRIIDYGKFKYDQKQEQKRRKKNQIVIELKEVKFRPKTEKHDFETKVRRIGEFLSHGDKVKATVMFRGREMAHPHLGEDVLRRVLAVLEGKIVVEQMPRLEGRFMSMMLAPKPGAWPKKPKPVEEVKKAKPTSENEAAPVDAVDADDLDEDLDEDDLDEDDLDEDEEDNEVAEDAQS